MAISWYGRERQVYLQAFLAREPGVDQKRGEDPDLFY